MNLSAAALPGMKHWSQRSICYTLSLITIMSKKRAPCVHVWVVHPFSLNKSNQLNCTWQIYDGPALEENQIHLQDEVEVRADKEEEATADVQTGLKDVEYASIDFSQLKKRSPREAAKRESTNTEYAEIKKDVKEERKDNVKAEGEMLGDKKEEDKIEETEETQCCAPKEEEEGEMAVYSNVKEIMDEV